MIGLIIQLTVAMVELTVRVMFLALRLTLALFEMLFRVRLGFPRLRFPRLLPRLPYIPGPIAMTAAGIAAVIWLAVAASVVAGVALLALVVGVGAVVAGGLGRSRGGSSLRRPDGRAQAPSSTSRRTTAPVARTAQRDAPASRARSIQTGSTTRSSPRPSTRSRTPARPRAQRASPSGAAALTQRDVSDTTAFIGLGDRLDAVMLPMIEQRLKDPDHTIREYALDYYLQLAGPRAREVVLDALDDENDFNRMHAFGKLRDYLEPEMLPLVDARLKDPDHTIRKYASDYKKRLAGLWFGRATNAQHPGRATVDARSRSSI